MFKLKRVYEEPSPEDRFRVLVERLWPRGVSKERAGLDLWLKDVAPSAELRKWFNHDPARWKEFQDRYIAELKDTRRRRAFAEGEGQGRHRHPGVRRARRGAQRGAGPETGP